MVVMMKLAITLTLFLLFLATAPQAMFIPVASIQPVERVNDDGVNVNICTSFSINKDKGYWLTANHCWHETNTFHGAPQLPVAWNEAKDLLVFESYKVEALHLAIKEPEVGDEVHIIGYPHGALDVLTFFGRVSSKDARVMHTLPGYHVQVLNILGLPGDSGAPILDTSGRVIGVGAISALNGVAWGLTWKQLVEDAGLKLYWEPNP